MSDSTYVGVSRPAFRHILAALLATTALTGGTAVAATYRIVVLPLPPGALSINPLGINNAGEIVGLAERGSNRYHAVAWDSTPDHAPRWLPEGDATESRAYHINDAGYIVGKWLYGTIADRAMMWTPDDMPVLLRGGEATGNYGYRINANRTVLGYIHASASTNPAIWLTPAAAHEISYDRDGLFVSVSVHALNGSGTVAGDARVNADNDQHGFRMTPGAGVQLLDELSGLGRNVDSYVFDMNEAGEVVGRASSDSHLATRALMWNADGSVLDLGDLPAGGDCSYSAFNINNVGVVTGTSFCDNDSQPIIWTSSTGMQRIVDLIDPDDPLYPQVASGTPIGVNDINDAGVMLGTLGDSSDSDSLVPILLIPQQADP